MDSIEINVGDGERTGRDSAVRQSLTPHVETADGRVAGVTVASGVNAFRGIPFAAPPIGDRRWRVPMPVESWTGVLDATRFAPRPMQPAVAPVGALPSLQAKLFFPPADHGQSEDCLYLNVWSTAPAGDKRPVMVWIHGGGFRAGATANPLYEGTHLASRGVVVVSIAYRVWKFGFLAHRELSAEASYGSSGNYGLLDQIAGLQWVRLNIDRFGGDPDNVTIFGQSAGATSVGYLSVSPLATGLFARAIAQSGGAFFDDSAAGNSAKPLADAEREGADWLARRGVASIVELRKCAAEELLDDARAEGFRSSWPIIDGYVVPEAPAATFARGAQNDVPLLTGSTADEGTAFPLTATLDDHYARAHATHGQRADAFLRLYPATDDASASAAAQDVFRDTTFGRHNWAWVNAQSAHGHAPAYYYHFTHPLPVEHGAYVENQTRAIGATHGTEIPYVFGTIDAFDEAGATDRELANVVMRYWVNFATNGDPNGPGLPHWPRFDPAEPRAMELDHTPAMAPLSRFAEYAFWSARQ
jgi:para-nitrobenzyl esterase